MSSRKEKVQFTLSRLGRFFKIFLKNKRGLVGLALVMFFVVMALGSSLLTPFNQLGYSGNSGQPVAGPEAEPGWVRFLPTALGGNPDLSENMFPMKNGDFTAESPLWPAGDWNLTISPTSDASAVTVQKITELGVSKMETSFLRAGSDPKGNVTISFSNGFYFPYTGPPADAILTWTLKLSGTMHEEDRQVWNITTDTYDTVPVNVTDVPSKISMNIIDPNGHSTLISPLTYGGIFNQTTGLATRFDYEQSFNDAVDTRSLFTEKGNYAIGLTIQLYDAYNNNTARDVEYALKVSNIDLHLLGTAWGILGTNIYGWDLWAQLVYGSRISLYVGLLAAVLGVSIGLVYGLAAGYSGRYVDEILMRISDVLLVLPGLPLLIVLFAVLGAKLENLIILNGLLGWMGFAKLVRSQVLSIRERPYIEAAKASGAGSMHILFRHVLPNVVSLVYVTFATSVPGAIVAEAALSWLGFVDYWRMSWGRMLEEMQAANAVSKWWWVVPPGLCIAAISIAFVLLGYALDEVLNPKLRMRK
jgi:ABC-type dipeptide/oligopeptide/nickel transport system permease subunit